MFSMKKNLQKCCLLFTQWHLLSSFEDLTSLGRWPPTTESGSSPGFCQLKGSFIYAIVTKCLLVVNLQYTNKEWLIDWLIDWDLLRSCQSFVSLVITPEQHIYFLTVFWLDQPLCVHPRADSFELSKIDLWDHMITNPAALQSNGPSGLM